MKKYILSALIISALFSPLSFASNFHKVLLVVAMDSEAEPIIKEFHLKPLNHTFAGLPMRGFSGKYNNISILLVENGTDPINQVPNIGTEAATLSTYLGIEYFHPDLIISIGTAGGVAENGAQLKTVYMSEKVNFFDRRIPMKGFYEYGLGSYRSATLNKSGFKTGIVCSGDSFDENPTDYSVFLREKCTAIDMEAAGVAWVAMLTHTPMVAIKGVTNFVAGKDIHAQFQANLPSVVSDCARKLRVLLNHL